MNLPREQSGQDNYTDPTGQILISGDWRPACGDHDLKNEVKRFYLSSLNSQAKKKAFFKAKLDLLFHLY